MKQLFLGLATLAIALFAGILIADQFREKPIGHLTSKPEDSRPGPKADGLRSICDLRDRDPEIGVTIALKGTLADFESSDTKMIDLDCTSNTVRVSCGESDMECKNVLADLKAAEAATAKVIVTGEYLAQDHPGSYNRPEHRFRIKRFVEVGIVSFATGSDQPYPSIEGARNRPAKKPETLKNKVNSYTPVGNGKIVGQRSSSGTGDSIKK